MIHRFQSPNGPPLFLLSLKAGGVGLNLTAANHVFHFDRWWNPAIEDQATDRSYRIGQVKNVQVHKFICIGTVEEKIDQMIEDKKRLAEHIVASKENMLTELSTEELRNIFALSRDGSLLSWSKSGMGGQSKSLGHGNSGFGSSVSQPAQIESLAGWKILDVAAGKNHALAVVER